VSHLQSAKTIDSLFSSLPLLKDRPWQQNNIFFFFLELNQSNKILIFFSPTEFVYTQLLANPEAVDIVFDLLAQHYYLDCEATIRTLTILASRSPLIAKRIRSTCSDLIVQISSRTPWQSIPSSLYDFLIPIARRDLDSAVIKRNTTIRTLADCVKNHWMAEERSAHPFLATFESKMHSRFKKPPLQELRSNRTEESKLKYNNIVNRVIRKHRKHVKKTKRYYPILYVIFRNVSDLKRLRSEKRINPGRREQKDYDDEKNLEDEAVHVKLDKYRMWVRKRKYLKSKCKRRPKEQHDSTPKKNIYMDPFYPDVLVYRCKV
jgi:hypothetical protein